MQLNIHFSDHFEKYLTQQKVIDMSLINDLKEKYAKPKETENRLENSIGGKGFDFVLNGKRGGQTRKANCWSGTTRPTEHPLWLLFKELTPDQQRKIAWFSHGGKKLFETKANRTKVLGALDFDKTATALVYSMQHATAILLILKVLKNSGKPKSWGCSTKWAKSRIYRGAYNASKFAIRDLLIR